MPMVYAKCPSGHENRKIVPIYKKEEGLEFNCFTNQYDDMVATGRSYPIMDNCIECNEPLVFGPDPESIKSGIYFNYIGE